MADFMQLSPFYVLPGELFPFRNFYTLHTTYARVQAATSGHLYPACVLNQGTNGHFWHIYPPRLSMHWAELIKIRESAPVRQDMRGHAVKNYRVGPGPARYAGPCR